MPNRALPLCLLLLSSVAGATGWSDFAPAFPVFPCVDGWSSCQTGDGVLSAEPKREGDVRQVSGSRLDWFTLQPGHGFDAHQHVFERSPQDVEPEVAVAPVLPEKVVEAPRHVAVKKEAPSDVPLREVRSEPKKQVEVSQRQVEKAAVAVVPPKERGTGDAAGCSDLLALRGPAGVGRLSAEQTSCLEASLASADALQDKVERSLMLIQNAWSADKGAWERLTRRHLSEIDDSDPDLAYRFARVQMRKGAAGAPDVLRWTAAAQKNKTRWTGASYRKNVYDLHKLETMAQQSLWKASEQGGGDVASAQEATRRAARDWVLFAESADLDANTPLTVCLAAGGERDWCAGA